MIYWSIMNIHMMRSNPVGFKHVIHGSYLMSHDTIWYITSIMWYGHDMTQSDDVSHTKLSSPVDFKQPSTYHINVWYIMNNMWYDITYHVHIMFFSNHITYHVMRFQRWYQPRWLGTPSLLYCFFYSNTIPFILEYLTCYWFILPFYRYFEVYVYFLSSGGWVKIKLKLPHFHVSDTCRVSI